MAHALVIARDWSVWIQLVLYFSFLKIATHGMAADLLSDGSLQWAAAASVFAPVSWVVASRLEYRHRVISYFFLGNRRIAQLGFAAYVLSFSIWRETLFSKAISGGRKWTSDSESIDEWIHKIGNLFFYTGTFLNLAGFYHVHINTYYPEYFGFVQSKLITAFPYNLMDHPMYIGAVLGHYGYALRVMSPTALYLAHLMSLGYWTVAKIFEEPFMEVFYGRPPSPCPKTKTNPQRNQLSRFFEFVYYVVSQWLIDKSKLKDGTLVRFNRHFKIRRYVKPADPDTIQYLTKELSRICQNELGSELPYRMFKGQGYDNKIVALLFPEDNPDKPCAFNVAVAWEYNGQPCLHYGLFIVCQEYQGQGLQAQLGLTNISLHVLDQRKDVWFTDIGRSPSGSRHFYSFHDNVCPHPVSEIGVSCRPKEPHLSIAKAAYHQFLQERDAGLSLSSKLTDFVIKGSNGPGGAEALVTVNGTTRSRNKMFNNWIDTICPDPEDEVIMVGKARRSDRTLIKLFQNCAWIAPCAVAVLVFSLLDKQTSLS